MVKEPTHNKSLVKDVTSTLESLKKIREPWEAQVDEIIEHVYHSRRLINDNSSSKGRKTGVKVYDGTALGALNLLTDGLTGHTISKNFKWFSYTLSQKIQLSTGPSRRLDEFPEVKLFLQETEEAMASAFLASNIYDVAPDMVREAASIGTITANMDEDIKNSRVVFSVPHFREMHCGENYFGKIDTNIRVRKLTLKQLVEKFGMSTMEEAYVPGKFKSDYEKDRNAEREIIHARYPRADIDPVKMGASNKPFASLWVLPDAKDDDHKLLKESGTDNQSFVTWRWRKNNDEWYGRSPAWDAFVDIMKGHQQARTNLIAGQKMAEPPMIGLDNLRGAVRRGPNGWTSVTSMDQAPRPLAEGIQLPFSVDQQERTDQAIRDHFSVDFFLLLSQAAMSGTELRELQVIEMTGEKAAILGQRVGRMETELLSPIHDVVYAIENRAGRMPQPPDILLEFGADLGIDYLGPLSRAQKKQFESQGIRQGLAIVKELAEVYPEVLDNINPDQTAKIALEANAFPQKAINDAGEVQVIRQNRQAAAQAQQEFEQGIETAKAMPAAGKEVSPNSALGVAAEAMGAGS